MSEHKKPRTLFILRKRDDSWGQKNPYSYNSSGLLNSAKFVNDMLKEDGYESHLVQIHDSNSIDREVYQYNPDIVILEAIWCPPEKLKELVKLHHHKHRKWIVRNHSELPFLAFEGISMQWLLEYATIPNVYVSCNSPVANEEVAELIRSHTGHLHNVLFLPNYYPSHYAIYNKEKKEKDTVDIGCFGSIRPLKNSFEQAVAAIIYARYIKKKLRYHINSTRIEGNAHNILKSIRAIFNGAKDAELIEETWMDRDEFLKLCYKMDLGLQVSFSETFNIVAADLVTQGTPVICSNEIPWMPEEFHADPGSAFSIAQAMIYVNGKGVEKQVKALREYSQDSKKSWISRIKEISND